MAKSVIVVFCVIPSSNRYAKPSLMLYNDITFLLKSILIASDYLLPQPNVSSGSGTLT